MWDRPRWKPSHRAWERKQQGLLGKVFPRHIQAPSWNSKMSNVTGAEMGRRGEGGRGRRREEEGGRGRREGFGGSWLIVLINHS